jgi:multicomponent Na+:H+ antiporter subunit G
MIWITYIFLAIGMVFQVLGTIALHRFPDVYTRIHGATKCTTFGSLFIYLGIIVYGIISVLEGKTSHIPLPFHTSIVMLFILITNPTGAHAIARAAHRSGVKPKMAVVDELGKVRK